MCGVNADGLGCGCGQELLPDGVRMVSGFIRAKKPAGAGEATPLP